MIAQTYNREELEYGGDCETLWSGECVDVIGC